jgi:hypothetical protein
MTALQKRIEAIEKVGAEALADHTLQKLIHLQLQKYEKQLAEVRRELEPFEQRYGMTSEEGHQRFLTGELGDAGDVMEWMGLYDDVLLYRERIATLQAAADA